MAEITAEEERVWREDVERAAALDIPASPDAWPAAYREKWRAMQEAPESAAGDPERAEVMAPGAAFTTADLTGEDVKGCRKFPMPGGKFLFIFPLSSAEMRGLARLTARIDPGIKPGDSPAEVDAKSRAAVEAARPYQVIICCYQDEERTKPCFKVEDAERLAKDLKGPRVARICAISDELGAEGVDIGGGDLRAFFMRALGCLSVWYSASATWDDCPSGLREQTMGLLSPSPDAA